MSQRSEERWNEIIHVIDHIAKPLVVISVVLYLVEGEMSLRNQWDNSYQSPHAFLWCERLIAGLFTVEFFVRWMRSNPSFKGARDSAYPLNVWGAIDLIAVLPFWLGFIVPTRCNLPR